MKEYKNKQTGELFYLRESKINNINENFRGSFDYENARIELQTVIDGSVLPVYSVQRSLYVPYHLRKKIVKHFNIQRHSSVEMYLTDIDIFIELANDYIKNELPLVHNGCGYNENDKARYISDEKVQIQKFLDEIQKHGIIKIFVCSVGATPPQSDWD